ncbi:MAG TPA: helix-turn-helix domain-containing protein [Chloroflexota bacterium]|nr:helix-turn-helix domain-containing protein [Chloroflexota bacterium]
MDLSAQEPWTSAEVVGRHLGVAKDTVYRWVRVRDLPAHRLGRLLKFRISEVDAWVAREHPPELDQRK